MTNDLLCTNDLTNKSCDAKYKTGQTTYSLSWPQPLSTGWPYDCGIEMKGCTMYMTLLHSSCFFIWPIATSVSTHTTLAVGTSPNTVKIQTFGGTNHPKKFKMMTCAGTNNEMYQSQVQIDTNTIYQIYLYWYTNQKQKN